MTTLRHNIASRSLLAWLLLLPLVLLSACSKEPEEASPAPAAQNTDYTIVVVYPLQREGDEIKKTLQWACQNIDKAQTGFDKTISFTLEWHDQDSEDIAALASQVCLRPEVIAVVGPTTSVDADIMADKMRPYRKTIISPCATSAELVRTYAGMGFFWSLTETDITQCEVLLSRAINSGAQSVSLLAGNDLYGQTFIDWFAFQAQEMGVKVTGVYTYDGDNDVLQTARRAIAEEHDYLICVPQNFAHLKTIQQLLYSLDPETPAPHILYADMAYTPEALSGQPYMEFMEGVTPTFDPESAFGVAYKVHFGSSPASNAPQYYDALLLLALAATEVDCGSAQRINEALTDIVKTTNPDGSARTKLPVWTSEALNLAMSAIRQGTTRYDISGATGSLDFDEQLLSSVVHSVYAHWMLYNNRYIVLNYLSSDGSHRTEASLASWNWSVSVSQDFDQQAVFAYPPCQGNWALLVAGSETWKNYRHQADVLNMYQILRYYGYDDDHIVLIMKDDIANNPANPHPGQVLRYDDVNLYVDVHKDYSLDDISADDIELILSGQRSDRLPHVIDASPNDNVLVFWSGHGEQGSLLLADRGIEQGLTTSRMTHLLQTLSQQQRYRKMLWLVETCYSASVAIAAEDAQIPGVLFMTAANAMETSKASQKIEGVYRSNRFSEILTETLRTNPDISYRDLYYNLHRQTIGSHVTVLNANRFDNLFTSGPKEFLSPVSHQ